MIYLSFWLEDGLVMGKNGGEWPPVPEGPFIRYLALSEERNRVKKKVNPAIVVLIIVVTAFVGYY